MDGIFILGQAAAALLAKLTCFNSQHIIIYYYLTHSHE